MLLLPLVAQRWLLRVGSIGPLGHLPASGTVTVAVVGIPLAWLMRTYLPIATYLTALAAFTALAVWVHGVGDRWLQEKDSQKLVLDELAGFLVAVAVLPLPLTWRWLTLAFFIERLIDIVKVPPANVIERKWRGGWGVVGDDVVAGLYTLGLLHLACRYLPAWVGLG